LALRLEARIVTDILPRLGQQTIVVQNVVPCCVLVSPRRDTR
jgi:hypothetical protein